MRRNVRRLNREIGQATQKLGQDAIKKHGLGSPAEVREEGGQSDEGSDGLAVDSSGNSVMSSMQITVKKKGSKRKAANLSGTTITCNVWL